MPKGLRRIHGGGDFHFITCSCYRRQPWLKSRRRRTIFLQILEQGRKEYRFILAGYVMPVAHLGARRNQLRVLRVPHPLRNLCCEAKGGMNSICRHGQKRYAGSMAAVTSISS